MPLSMKMTITGSPIFCNSSSMNYHIWLLRNNLQIQHTQSSIAWIGSVGTERRLLAHKDLPLHSILSLHYKVKGNHSEFGVWNHTIHSITLTGKQRERRPDQWYREKKLLQTEYLWCYARTVNRPTSVTKKKLRPTDLQLSRNCSLVKQPSCSAATQH